MESPVPQIARFDDLDLRTAYGLLKLRVDVFVVEQQCPYAELDGRDVEDATRHLWIADDGTPVGYLRLLDDGDVARIGRVCVAASHRGQGLAAVLMDAALAVVGARRSVLDAQAHLADWYARFGYAVAGEMFLEDGIPHLPMARG